jgi:hypothetical protein
MSTSVELDAVTDLLAQYEPVERCQASLHPEHDRCGAPAQYALHWVDAAEDEVWTRHVCHRHVWGYFLSVRWNTWCPCEQPHRECPKEHPRVERIR